MTIEISKETLDQLVTDYIQGKMKRMITVETIIYVTQTEFQPTGAKVTFTEKR